MATTYPWQQNLSRTAMVAGGTGLVGRHLVNQLLTDDAFDHVVMLVRRLPGLQHPKLHLLQIDFDEPVTFNNLVQGQALFICLGTTMKKAGSRAAFYKVDAEYVLNLARAAASNSVQQVAMISAMGADKFSLFYYNRVKGLVEDQLQQLGLHSLHIFRPSLLVGQREESRFGENIAVQVSRLFHPLIPDGYKPIEGATVARAMLNSVKQNKPGVHYYLSDRIQLLGRAGAAV